MEPYLAWENERFEAGQLHDTEKRTLLGLGEWRRDWAPGPGWSQAMSVVPSAGWPSGDRTVGIVAGMASGGVFLELLAKGAIMEKSGRGRGVGGRQRWGSQWGQKTAPE